MKRLTYLTSMLLALAVIAGLSVSSCKKNTEEPPPPVLKIGLLGGVAGFDDHGFNESALLGLQRAAVELGLYTEAVECNQPADYAANIDYFVKNNFNLIIALGFDAAKATAIAATNNPSIKFGLIDFSQSGAPSNLQCAVFDVDQASFPCGFLAAYWANLKTPSYAATGYIAGPDIPEIRQFSKSYEQGILYFNSKYNKKIRNFGFNSISFSDSTEGARLADSLIRLGSEVIFTFAGTTGIGALHQIKQSGKWGIGVDVDQYYSIPEVGSILLTSCMKRLDKTVYEMVYSFATGNFTGGQTTHWNLENSGVEMAPFHDYETLIPDSIKVALGEIKAGIINGTINTGWPK